VAIPAYLTRHITGASSGFGNLTARAVARAGHTVYAGMRATTGRNAAQVAQLAVRCSLPHPC
jgi:NADP-dependent 3-hydroxy acid dehydrogenase YdfG